MTHDHKFYATKLLRSHKKKPGAAPGTLTTPARALPPEISVIIYNAETLIEKDIKSVSELKSCLQDGHNIWININGLGDLDVLEEIGALFNLHPLALEDVLNLEHRAKTENFEDYLFIITRMARLKEDLLDIEQLSLFLGENFILTFQERTGDVFDPVRVRLRSGQGRLIREKGTSYLAYAIIDAIIDGYFPLLEHYGEYLNILEDEVLEHPTKTVMGKIHGAKRDLRLLRQQVWPMREMVNNFAGSTKFITPDIQPFVRDCYEHVIHVIDMLETARERASGLIEIYLSSLSNRTNEVMQVLTIIATIFIPLGFLAGLYGMNFDTSSPYNMPELNWQYGYPALLLVMFAVAGGLLLFFRSKGWLGGNSDD